MAPETLEPPSPDSALSGRARWRRVAAVLCLGLGVGLALATFFRSRPVEVTLEFWLPAERFQGVRELFVSLRAPDGTPVSESVFFRKDGQDWRDPLRHSLRLPRGSYRVTANARCAEGDLRWQREIRIEQEGTQRFSWNAP